MGLLRGVARTAVVAGTATAVSNRVSRRQAGRWADQEQQAAPQSAAPPQYEAPPQYAAPEPVAAPPAGSGMDSKLAQLKELGALREQGVLSDAEFEAQKARILAG
ncbi:SHOCT domain-containing protein [Georgenia yuyongxinii]|uniref:SHOCT domain-containing protein n=1 Tax=Georgenia yuyongxinii TaxID=2589797 RepID=A0A5B8C4Q9_9MICO|nr:SHOCT domain-containing protein [Georgenia yuyongxinii]QDC25308.1 SHOCT domain-containing protein [Georgenia yuyongxinii]